MVCNSLLKPPPITNLVIHPLEKASTHESSHDTGVISWEALKHSGAYRARPFHQTLDGSTISVSSSHQEGFLYWPCSSLLGPLSPSNILLRCCQNFIKHHLCLGMFSKRAHLLPPTKRDSLQQGAGTQGESTISLL